jgi:hypothetical protein
VKYEEKSLKKLTSLASVAALAAALTFPIQAANAACVDQAIWTQDGDSSEIKKWSVDGTLLQTISVPGGISTSDIAISSDLQKFLAPQGDQLLFWDSSTGEPLDSQTISGAEIYGAGAGVVAGGKLLADDYTTIYSIDLTTYVATVFADLNNADNSVDAGLRGFDWTVAGDLLQLPDGDILAVSSNSNVYSDGVILVRISSTNPSTVTAVGTVASDAAVWGAARAGDEIFLATENGSLLKVASIPTSASLDPVTTTTIVSGGGSFWGAAGSNDSTEGNATCETPAEAAPAAALATTGAESALTLSLFAGALAIIALGGSLLISRRKTQGESN